MPNKLTINFTAASPAPSNGYLVRYWDTATPGTGQYDITTTADNITVGSFTLNTGSEKNITVADHSGVANGTDNSEIEYSINIENEVTLTKAQTFTKSKKGTDGDDGATGKKVKELIQPSLIAIPINSPLVQTPTFNQAVRHRPDIGLELGFTLNYSVTKKLQFKTGLQLNIRQYQIDTYESGANAATLALVNGGRVQTVSVMSSYTNNVGFRSAKLNNKVYQIALPVGLDYQLFRFKKFGIHTQATIQPTYNINNNVYLLSTDYANYAAGNDYVRKWNINTSAGIQFSYQKGNTIWQLGPQIRYQTLPTYNNPYPIKENLIDYGFRIGWSKQFK